MQKVLFIGLVWPEPESSAAGTRIVQLVELFCTASYTVTFASAAAQSPFSHNWGTSAVKEQQVSLNDSMFDAFIKELQPDIVVFDRFTSEEQYGWRVREAAPEAITILDTEDLHFLRKARQTAVHKKEKLSYYNAITTREIAAILRCDISLLISKVEMEILTHVFRISPSLLFYMPFLEEEINAKKVARWKNFKSRKDFIFIGNFLHEPNWHTVLLLKNEVWPQLSALVPEAELHIYGAYASEKVYQLHNPRRRFFIKDRALHARDTMEKYRILLAPIPFGAGAKGKFIDAMQSGTPSITTSIGAESMSKDGKWNGFIIDDWPIFAEKAQLLYQTPSFWTEAQQTGVWLLNSQYSKNEYNSLFLRQINELRQRLALHRQENIIGEILKSQQFNSTKYMSLWIEEKNKHSCS